MEHLRRFAAASLPLAALLAAAWLVASPSATSFSLNGSALGVDQRHLRVFDNFADASANDNTVPHASFPGASGAALALWKAAVEWGSTLHGDGSGDASQPFDLGSGGANYDPSWQGLATGIGGTNDNVHSAISGSGGGQLAFTETPTSDGWRTRYYEEPWIWDDGPGAVLPAGNLDLQGHATRELGHALGLGNSSVLGATMGTGSTDPSGVELRSIEPDDVAGVQAVYGVASPEKPRIATWAVAGGVLHVIGSGFAPTGNEVWFTSAASGGTGVPVKASGLSSTDGGTLIALTPPPEAGPGDLLVKLPGSGFDTLSNAFPWAPVCAVVPYGLGLGAANTGRLACPTPPVLGTSISLEVYDITLDGLLSLGFSLGRSTLPIFGGTLLIDPFGVLFMLHIPVTGGTGTLPLFLPPDPTLDGIRLDLQGIAFDPTLPELLAFTNGIELWLCQ